MAIEATESWLNTAHRALADHNWKEALEAFTKADGEVPLSGPDLERLSDVAFFTGDGELVIETKERAFRTYQSDGVRDRAAFMALSLAREYLFKGMGSISSAWFRRAERILKDEPEGFAHGFLALSQSEIARSQGRLEAAQQLAERAVAIGSQFANPDLLAQALVALGTIKISMGAVDEGFELMEEATVAAINGELSPFFTGVTYCQMIAVCRDLADYTRASEWTDAAERWCQRQSIGGFPGICRVHRAEVVAMAGAWERAEEELMRATRELANYNATPPMADGFYAIAMIRYRRGDLGGAEESLRQAHALGRSPQPLLALIRLAQGQVRTAFGAIKAALTEQMWDQWVRVRLLPVKVEIAIAAGELSEAREAAEELEQLVATYDSLAMQSERDLTLGRLLLAEGDYPAAIRQLRRAIDEWGRVAAPYEVAVGRWLLGMALYRVHDDDAAELELAAARSEFARLGATLAEAAVVRDIQAAVDRKSGPAQTRMTFMFTDIVGSTNLAELLGDQAWDQLLRWHDDALRAAIRRKTGQVVNSTGDGFFVAFAAATPAIECAIDIQRLLADHRRTTGFAPMVRIGVHSAIANQTGSDYSGVGVHVAARIGALATGGEIVASIETLAEAGDPPVGERRTVELKGVAEPVAVASVNWS
jgi:class 3 adenylate cyclase